MTRRLKPKLDILALFRKALTSKMEVDILTGLRIMEHLGRNQPTTLSYEHPLDDEVVQILNWISLFIVSDSPSSHHDRDPGVAIAISAQPGIVTIHISSGAGPPGKHECDNLGLFMDTLRHAFQYNLAPSLIEEAFLFKLVNQAYPQIIQKITAVHQAESGDPAQTLEHFRSLVSVWLHYRPEGEISKGFVDRAVYWTGTKEEASNTMVETFFRLLYNVGGPEMAHEGMEKYGDLVSIMISCDLLVGSTFFDDFINQEEFRESLEVSDLIFLHELFRRLTKVSCYKTGLEEFVYRGIPYLKKILHHEGMNNFLQNNGGIVVNWVNKPLPLIEKTCHLPISPSDKIRQVLVAETVDLDHLDADMREHICQKEAVTGAWTKGEVVALKIHCELQLISYLEEEFIDIKDSAIGTSSPVCWACYCYIKEHKSRRWKISQTSGEARDDWFPPPGHPSFGAVLRSFNERVEEVVEGYACEFYP